MKVLSGSSQSKHLQESVAQPQRSRRTRNLTELKQELKDSQLHILHRGALLGCVQPFIVHVCISLK